MIENLKNLIIKRRLQRQNNLTEEETERMLDLVINHHLDKSKIDSLIVYDHLTHKQLILITHLITGFDLNEKQMIDLCNLMEKGMDETQITFMAYLIMTYDLDDFQFCHFSSSYLRGLDEEKLLTVAKLVKAYDLDEAKTYYLLLLYEYGFTDKQVHTFINIVTTCGLEEEQMLAVSSAIQNGMNEEAIRIKLIENEVNAALIEMEAEGILKEKTLNNQKKKSSNK